MYPTGINILVKPLPSSSTTKGGIVVPDSVKKPSNKVIIIKTGDKVKHLTKGDVVYRVSDWGTEIMMGGELHYLMGQDGILALNG